MMGRCRVNWRALRNCSRIRRHSVGQQSYIEALCNVATHVVGFLWLPLRLGALAFSSLYGQAPSSVAALSIASHSSANMQPPSSASPATDIQHAISDRAGGAPCHPPSQSGDYGLGLAAFRPREPAMSGRHYLDALNRGAGPSEATDPHLGRIDRG
jgi:hypothetical protein